MRFLALSSLAALIFAVAAAEASEAAAESLEGLEHHKHHHRRLHHHHHHRRHHKHKHHHKHHHRHHRHHAHHSDADPNITADANGTAEGGASAPMVVVMAAANRTSQVVAKVGAPVKNSSAAPASDEEQIMLKMQHLEKQLSAKEKKARSLMSTGSLEVNGPLPEDFSKLFMASAAEAVACEPSEVKVLRTSPEAGRAGVVQLLFQAPEVAARALEAQAADPDSKLAQGQLHDFLVERAGEEEREEPGESAAPAPAQEAPAEAPPEDEAVPPTPVQNRGIDIDTAMPFGELEPFGREDTAQELTEDSIKESDQMVDQLERAEVAEEKRAVFRALTRLRGAAIASFDGVARSQTGNIDEYSKVHKWRNNHPLRHLADEESDYSKWAFPDNADF